MQVLHKLKTQAFLAPLLMSPTARRIQMAFISHVISALFILLATELLLIWSVSIKAKLLGYHLIAMWIVYPWLSDFACLCLPEFSHQPQAPSSCSGNDIICVCYSVSG